MNNSHVTLIPLEDDDREQFIRDNQEAFLFEATQEFGVRDEHFEKDGQIISRATIEASIDGEHAEAYRIWAHGEKAGGLVLSIDPKTLRGELDLLFVSPHTHSRGVGQAAWWCVEALHPEVRVWELVTPYFERRNIHFYVNKLGFHIVEYFCDHHPDPHDTARETAVECFASRRSCEGTHRQTNSHRYRKGVSLAPPPTGALTTGSTAP